MNTGFKGKNHDVFAYNGGLFVPDDVLDNIHISDETLLPHLQSVSRYDFSSEVDVNILGHIFENSLTEIEEITSAISANTELKTIGKRKKDGVFYTPRYITAYIVENTLGKLCADKKAAMEIDEAVYSSDKKRTAATKRKLEQKLIDYRVWLLSLTICDPACGSGAFLNAAHKFLMDEHNLIGEMRAKLYDGEGWLFDNIENDILENNLYGVDINEESVEIAKLALWLRTAKPHRKLNSLNNNIKCGNSLISDSEVAGDKAFDWEKEFPQVFEKGGFDVVIGNPPWGAKVPNTDKVYINENYICKKGELETYVHFIDLIINKLLKKQGILGLITPNTWYYLDKYIDLRKLLLSKKVIELVELEKNIFKDAPDIVPAIFIVSNVSDKNNYEIITHVLRKGNVPDFLIDLEIMDSYSVKKDNIEKFENLTFNLKLTKEKVTLLKKMSNNSTPLSDLYNVRYGIKTGNNDKYVNKEKTGEVTWKLCIAAASAVKRYSIKWEGDYLNFGTHLSGYSNNSFENPKILVQYIRKLSMDIRIVSAFDAEGCYYPLNNFSFIEQINDEFKLEYLLAIINSKATNFYFKNTFIDYNIKPKYLELLPIKNISISEQRPFVNKVDKMRLLNSELQTKRQRFLKRLSENFTNIKITGALGRFDELEFKQFTAELKKQKIALSLKQQDEWEEYFCEYKKECCELVNQINVTDKEIDRMVYELYGLGEEEIGVVENKK
jgi:type I restriction-modification system DNA methylase subunit